MGSVRQPTIKQFGACRNCECNIAGYGKCKEGYDNFYYRISKKNGCDKCKNEKRDRRIEESISRIMRGK